MESAKALLPCPFCGRLSPITTIELAELIDADLCHDISRFDRKYITICSAASGGCGGSGPQASSYDSAEDKWNIYRVKNSSLKRISDYG